MKEVYTNMEPSEIESENLCGIYRDIANLLGVEAAIKIHSAYRGTQVTFPVSLVTKDFIADKIIREYDGTNIKKLASKYGYSEKWVKKIIKERKND
ncbi:MAG: Mor transcription activator family protein [Escherichia coli]|nr:MAG: Mor transcription activator family protein [Escherichia coli]